MAVLFERVFVDKVRWYSVDKHPETSIYFISIPRCRSVVSYEDYYRITLAEFEMHTSDPARFLELVDRCENHGCENRLVKAWTMEGILAAADRDE